MPSLNTIQENRREMFRSPWLCLWQSPSSGWCGSYAPGAQPLPEPPQHTALATMGCNAAGDSRFGSRELHMAAAAITRKARRLLTTPCASALAACSFPLL